MYKVLFKNKILSISLFILIFGALILFLNINPNVVEAKTYICGQDRDAGQLWWCAFGRSAYDPYFCKEDEVSFKKDFLKRCCPQGTTPGLGSNGVICCKYNNVAQGGDIRNALCCPSGWKPSQRTDIPPLCSYMNERCESQDECNGKDGGTTLAQDSTDPHYRCNGNDCLEYETHLSAPDWLCYKEWTVMLDGSEEGKYCKGGSWVVKPPDCGDGTCELGKEDDPDNPLNNPDYCPTDCGSVTGTGPTSLPVPIFSCQDLCKGEGIVDTATGSFKPGEQYSSCCSCVCGVPDCPTDITVSHRFKTNNLWTEVGCINATEKGIVIAVMRIFLGVVTTIALFRFVQAAFMMNTDDPEKIKEGKSIFASAITAIFAAVLMPIVLNFMGIKILGDKIGAIFDIFSR
jgi:hypothetical protein